MARTAMEVSETNEGGETAPPIGGQQAFLELLGTRERQALLEAGRRRRFKNGEALFHEGDPGHSVYFLHAGRVKPEGYFASDRAALVRQLPHPVGRVLDVGAAAAVSVGGTSRAGPPHATRTRAIAAAAPVATCRGSMEFVRDIFVSFF